MIYLFVYAGIMFTLVYLRDRRQEADLSRFLVADRRVGGLFGAMSIAASWIWAPAIFVSTRVGYEWGYSGLLWFIVPNMLALILFAPVAGIVRKRIPAGYSYIEFLRTSDPRFRNLQLSIQLGMQVIIFAIQLTAGAELLSTLTGAHYSHLVLGMGLTPLLYTFRSGLRTSVFTDALQYATIFAAATIILFCFPWAQATLPQRSFQPLEPGLLINFGISSALGLMVAIFADHQQWQRAFAVKEGLLIPVYWGAAMLHGYVTFLLGTLGILIFQSNYHSSGSMEMVGINFIQSNYPGIFVVIFVTMALCALISTLDSGLCAFSSLWLTDASKRSPALARGRLIMLLHAAAGILVALVHLPLITLWFMAGTIRLATFAPTVLSIIQPNFSGS